MLRFYLFSLLLPTDKHTIPNIELLFVNLRKQVVYFLHERTLINWSIFNMTQHKNSILYNLQLQSLYISM
jgi:hypothetical protein